jgi:phospholipid transport system substrate-binding protein
MPELNGGREKPGPRRRRVLTAALGLLTASVVPPVGASWAAATPTGTIENFDNVLLSIMKSGRSSAFVDRFNTLAPVVDQTFDLDTILRNSIGMQWNGLSGGQRESLLATFRRYTVATWVANFDNWSGQQFSIDPDVRHVAADVVVPTDLISADGSPTRLSYVMRQEGQAWRVVDVLAEGSISRVAVQRSDFRSLLANGGVPALQASLQKKITSLSDGSLA